MFPSAHPAPVLIQQGKLLDFIDGKTQRQENPEEYVRQEILKSLVREYHYPKTDVAVEFIVPIGSKKTRADVVIFVPDTAHTVENAFMVECKSERVKPTDRKEGVEQLQSYLAACPNAAYGMWTNGIERFCYRRLVEAGKVNFEEVPDVPTFGQKADDAERPRHGQLKAATSDALLFAFRRCHNYIAANQGLQKPEAFWELLKLIFCKIQDERADIINFYATAPERKSLNGQLAVKSRLDKLFAAVRADFPAIFQPKDGLDLHPPVLAYLVSQLQGYSLLQSDVDVKGHAYEEIVGSNLRGDRGEFFTPRNLCDMAVTMLDPAEGQLMLDPACGTGGFLIAAMNHVIEKIRAAELKKWNGDAAKAEIFGQERIKKYAGGCIVGLDFNPNLVKATKMNMVMNNDGAGGLYQANSLAHPLRWAEDLRVRDLLGRVDVLFSNPPFGSKLPIDDQTVLEQYDLGYAWTYDKVADRWRRTGNLQKSQPPEILFIERIVRFLKPGTGRAAIVLPDGILGAPGLGYVREWLLTHCRLLASVDMHPDTFQPNVSVQTSLLLVQRKTDGEMALEEARGQRVDYPVFMAVANHIGHDKRGNRTYVRDERGNEVVEPVTEMVRVAGATGGVEYRPQTTLKKVLDDNTQQIAQAFRQWLHAHS